MNVNPEDIKPGDIIITNRHREFFFPYFFVIKKGVAVNYWGTKFEGFFGGDNYINPDTDFYFVVVGDKAEIFEIKFEKI